MSDHEDRDDDEITDEQARQLLDQMDAPAETPTDATTDTDGSPEELSEDEALKLMQEMDDGPAETPKPAQTADTSEPAADEMSDDQAKMLLAQMDDAPAEPATDTAEPPKPAEPDPNTEPPATSPPPPATSPAPESALAPIPEWEENEFQSDPVMMEDFLTNSDELLEELDKCILELENDPQSKETIEKIFRAAHTLKGAAGMFGFVGLEKLTHRMENLFDLIRKGKLTATESVIDILLASMDIIRNLIDAVKAGSPCGVDIRPMIVNLEAAATGKPVEPTAAPVSAPAPKAEKPVKKNQSEASTIKVDLSRLDHLVNLIGELVIDRTRFSAVDEDLRLNQPHLDATGDFSETLQHFSRHMNSVQDIIMQLRMVPIGNAFNKYPRIVRDLAKSLNKQIDLVIEGEHNELDKTLVEKIGDPLIHLIRNACDHGIETPEVRGAAGKGPRGTVHLTASQLGNQIAICIKDDGKGMDPEVIRKKAVEKGLITGEAQLSDSEIFDLIFEAGFSTAEQVTNVSGRGVGMDVVKKQITQMKGSLSIKSKLGKGSTIEIRLPLTLAIVKSLLVRSESQTFALPMDNVSEVFRLDKSKIEVAGDTIVTRLRDDFLPLISLPEALESQSADDVENENPYVLVITLGERRFGMVVEGLLGRQEIVIKSLGPLFRASKGIAGGAVMGDGRVILVLDVSEIAEIFRTKTRNAKAA